jgi:putative hydrolase of the HAD superfamily
VLLLDLDDTILDDTGCSDECWSITCKEAAAARPGLDPLKLRQELDRVGGAFWNDPDRRAEWRLRMREAWGPVATEALAVMGIDDPALGTFIGARHFELRDRAMTPLPGAIAALRRLRSRRVRLGLVTNGGSDTQRSKIERFELEPYFDYIAIEGEVGIGKPDRAAYENGLQQLAANAEETWMVGDSLERDVAGAQAAGILGIWLDRHARGLSTESPRPDRVIRSLAELI